MRRRLLSHTWSIPRSKFTARANAQVLHCTDTPADRNWGCWAYRRTWHGLNMIKKRLSAGGLHLHSSETHEAIPGHAQCLQWNYDERALNFPNGKHEAKVIHPWCQLAMIGIILLPSPEQSWSYTYEALQRELQAYWWSFHNSLGDKQWSGTQHSLFMQDLALHTKHLCGQGWARWLKPKRARHDSSRTGCGSYHQVH